MCKFPQNCQNLYIRDPPPTWCQENINVIEKKKKKKKKGQELWFLDVVFKCNHQVRELKGLESDTVKGEVKGMSQFPTIN